MYIENDLKRSGYSTMGDLLHIGFGHLTSPPLIAHTVPHALPPSCPGFTNTSPKIT